MYIMDWESDGQSHWTFNYVLLRTSSSASTFQNEIFWNKLWKFHKISWNFTKGSSLLSIVYMYTCMLLLIPEIFLFSKCSFSILENPKKFLKIPEGTDQQGANAIDYVERSSALLEVLVLHRTLLKHSVNAFLALKIWYGVHHRLIVRRAITLNIQLCFENQKGAYAIDNVQWSTCSNNTLLNHSVNAFLALNWWYGLIKMYVIIISEAIINWS